jgi:hypothetical protein
MKKGTLITHTLIILISLFLSINSYAQYAPQVGLQGCDAISFTSPAIINWAKTCTVTRGWLNILDTTLGKVNHGDEVWAVGNVANNGVVSLGDGGSALLTFHSPIKNGAGPDFAVFENSFTTSDTLAFIELAFVEVSSDGVHFVRFPANSNTDTINQTGAFTAMDAAKMNNLAGKYIAGYGVPFDLEILKDSIGIDVNSITHLRLVDVIGVLHSNFSTLDIIGREINDPFPTPFPSGGFDLDAVAVLYDQATAIDNINENSNNSTVSPNPFIDKFTISNQEKFEADLFDVLGVKVNAKKVGNTVYTSDLPIGVYLLKINSGNKVNIHKITKSHF